MTSLFIRKTYVNDKAKIHIGTIWAKYLMENILKRNDVREDACEDCMQLTKRGILVRLLVIVYKGGSKNSFFKRIATIDSQTKREYQQHRPDVVVRQ